MVVRCNGRFCTCLRIIYVSDLEKDGYMVKIYCKYNVKIYHK